MCYVSRQQMTGRVRLLHDIGEAHEAYDVAGHQDAEGADDAGVAHYDAGGEDDVVEVVEQHDDIDDA